VHAAVIALSMLGISNPKAFLSIGNDSTISKAIKLKIRMDLVIHPDFLNTPHPVFVCERICRIILEIQLGWLWISPSVHSLQSS
jgi:hypothetical protein